MIKASKLQNIFLPFRFKRENVCLRTSHPDYINIRSFEKLHEFMSRKTFFLSFLSQILWNVFIQKKTVAAAHFAT